MAKSRGRAHRWIVDAIEEGTARCEVDGDRVMHVPAWLLPPDARAGSVLRVRHARAGGMSRLVIVVEDGASPPAPAPMRTDVRAAGTGDIVL